MNRRLFIISLATFALVSCSDFPKDANSTLERIRTERAFRVGLDSPSGKGDPDRAVEQFIGRIGGAAQASPELVRGETEVLLTALEEGRLDLVVGRFEKKSPWAARVTFGPPLRKERQGKAELLLRPAMQNGENAWIALIEKQARDLAPAAQ
jgi:hypothetical protein